MRFAAIADIHGNALALEAVLADIDRLGIKTVVNLGDHVSGPIDPARTADILMARNFASIAGNHERQLLSLAPEAMGRTDRWALGRLTTSHMNWLRTLPQTRLFNDDVLLCHGTPTSDDTYWMEYVTDEGAVTTASRDNIEKEASGVNSSLILCGHTHTPRIMHLNDGQMLVNPGSVGCPAYRDATPVPHAMSTGSPDARYAIIEGHNRRWSADLKTVAYDHMAAARLAEAAGRSDWASALATGWAQAPKA
jgi:putative phosphoesterase